MVITSDTDLAKIVATSRGRKPPVVTLRLDNPTAEEQIAALERMLAHLSLEDLEGALVTLERDGYRKRRLPIEELP